MFNVTVINIKKSTRYIVFLLITLVIIYLMNQIVSKVQNTEIIQINISEQLAKCLSREIPAIESTYYKSSNTIKEDDEEDESVSMIEKILSIELAQIQNSKPLENKVTEIAETGTNEEKTEERTNELEKVSTNVETQVVTQVVTQNLIAESYNVEINGVKIKNETSFQITDEIWQKQLEINKENILIFHTHTCESYTPSETYQYEQTGNFRTTDLNYSVARVGDELTNYLMGYGFKVTHDKTYHDYPAYTGSYTRSKATVENILQTNPSDIIIDLHRDAIGSKSNYDPSVKIGEETAAQLMFVIGTNGGGLYHPNWESNLKFAMEVQQKANELYPGLFKPIIVRKSRYNQHLGSAACIIEVGATGNTLEQCLTSMKYLAKILDEI